MSFAMALKYTFDRGADADLLERAVMQVLDKGFRTGDIMQADMHWSAQARWVMRCQKPSTNWGIEMSYVVAVIGATGNVGREMLNILAERNFPIVRVDAVALAAPRAKR